MIVVVRDRPLAGEPGIEFRVRDVGEPLQLGNFHFGQLSDGSVREAPHDQVHFPRAAMPRSVQQPPLPLVKPRTRARRSGHRKPLAPPNLAPAWAGPNAKSPDGPGASL